MRLSKPQKKLWPPTPDEAKTFTTGDVGHAGLTRHTPHNRATRALPYTIPPRFPIPQNVAFFPITQSQACIALRISEML